MQTYLLNNIWALHNMLEEAERLLSGVDVTVEEEARLLPITREGVTEGEEVRRLPVK